MHFAVNRHSSNLHSLRHITATQMLGADVAHRSMAAYRRALPRRGSIGINVRWRPSAVSASLPSRAPIPCMRFPLGVDHTHGMQGGVIYMHSQVQLSTVQCKAVSHNNLPSKNRSHTSWQALITLKMLENSINILP